MKKNIKIKVWVVLDEDGGMKVFSDIKSAKNFLKIIKKKWGLTFRIGICEGKLLIKKGKEIYNEECV